MKPVYLIAAIAQNRVIGNQGKLPWSIPEDWQYLLDTTRGGILLLGRRCYEEFGGALPEREMVVLTRQTSEKFSDVHCAGSFEQGLAIALSLPGQAIWIAGGQEVYREALPHAQAAYITHIHAQVPGDTFFPEDWESYFPHCQSKRDSHDANYSYTFCVYQAE